MMKESIYLCTTWTIDYTAAAVLFHSYAVRIDTYIIHTYIHTRYRQTDRRYRVGYLILCMCTVVVVVACSTSSPTFGALSLLLFWWILPSSGTTTTTTGEALIKAKNIVYNKHTF